MCRIFSRHRRQEELLADSRRLTTLSQMKNRPAYSIESVDNAFRLAQLLQHEGSLGITEAAEWIGVAPSTAHRLMAMLVYRAFAERGADRRYRPGPLLRPAGEKTSSTTTLRRLTRPHLQRLSMILNETVNLQVRVGTEVRFIDSVECDQVVKVGDRTGQVVPAHKSSGGKVLLAALPDDAVRQLYLDSDETVDIGHLLQELAMVRKRRFAINNEETEHCLSAVAVPIYGKSEEPVAVLAVALPSFRFKSEDLPRYISALSEAAVAIGDGIGESLAQPLSADPDQL